jgi:hypothetical protein
MKGTFELDLPRAWSTRPVGSLSRIWKVGGFTTAKSRTKDIIFWPMESFAPLCGTAVRVKVIWNRRGMSARAAIALLPIVPYHRRYQRL